jgi:polyferredoxin
MMARQSQRQKIRKALGVVMILVFPFVYYYMSPYLVIMGAAEGIIAGDVIFFAGLFVTALFFGRAWCGWVCPAGALQEFCSKVNGRSFNGRKRNLIKYFIWAPWIAIVVIMFAQAGIRSVDPLYQTWNGISIQDLPSLILFAAIAEGFAVFVLLAGKRAGCHTVCWMAPFMVIATRIKNAAGWPSLHLTADKGQCVQCRQCSKRCPMSLNVTEMVQKEDMSNDECILCGSCVDNCPKKAVRFSFSSLKDRA